MTDAALLVDKPAGLSSNAVLQAIKRLFGAAKAGHAGTLDPLATGLLIVLFGEATKFAGPLLDADKQYRATLRLGVRTATGDAEGEVLEKKSTAVSAAMLLAVLDRFRGEIEQVPPMHSALKRDGVPLYKLARRGLDVERKPRRIRISELELLRFDCPEVELRVRCSKGTYIRSLAQDIGEALGSGAHLACLRRTASGRFRVEDAATPEALASMPPQERERRLLPLAFLLEGLPREELDPHSEARFRNGQALETSLAEGVCGVFRRDGSVIGLGKAEGARLRPLRLTASG